MKILIACEFSGIVREEFKKRGHDAMSCDFLPTEIPGNHYQGDVMDIINDGWDMMIAFPSCTYLSYASIRWFNIERYGDKAVERVKLKHKAIEFFLGLWMADIDKICIENPRGYIQDVLPYTQLINPFYFGDSFSKPTLLWLKKLQQLKHYKEDTLFGDKSTHVDKGEFVYHKTKKGKIKGDAKWYTDAFRLSPDERAKTRSRTFLGIAKAMAEQWG